jgi:hypothetical protein
MDDIDSRVAAFHEAGHQLMAFYLGYSVEEVQLTEDGGRSFDSMRFRMHDPYANSPEDNRHFRDKTLILLSGKITEGCLLKREGIQCSVCLAVKDDLEVESHYSVYTREGAQPPEELKLEALHRECEIIIEAGWKRLARLAELLLQHGRLDRGQVTECLLGHGILWDDE